MQTWISVIDEKVTIKDNIYLYSFVNKFQFFCLSKHNVISQIPLPKWEDYDNRFKKLNRND